MNMGAIGDGVTDDMKAIQKALTKAGSIGGGTVYLPAGTYRINGTLNIPTMVTMRGDFRGPDDDDTVPGNGTVLLAYAGRGDDSGTAFITLNASTSVMNLTVYYPEQQPGNIVAYPPTVSDKTVDQPTAQMVKNCWFVNSYYMADFCSAEYASLHYVENLYGTPLNYGINVDNCYDIGRIEGVYFSPQYWLKAQEIGLSASYENNENATMFSYVHEKAVGISLYRSDWEYVYNYNADSLHVAIDFPKSGTKCANIQMSQSTFVGCTIGINLQVISGIGSVISNTTIVASSEEGSLAVLSPKGNNDNPVQFNNCRFEGKSGSAVSMVGPGILEFVNCTFTTESNESYAVDMSGSGSLYIEQCTFENESHHVHVGANTKTLHILGCTFVGKPDVLLERESGYKVTVNNTPLNLPIQSGLAHQYKASEPTPLSSYVYYVYDYGARINIDCTQALRDSLAAAAKTGGTVYFPGGQYIITGTITVPSGVELRGCSTGSLNPYKLKGTVLMAKPAIGENGDALIKLESNAGISGLSIYYSDQAVTLTTAIAYPWTIQGLGDGVWIKNVCLINPYKGVDFSTYSSENHYIWYLTGAPLKVGISVGNNSGNGWVEDAHFNPGYWSNLPAEYACKNSAGLIGYERDNLDAFVFGDNYAEHILDTFVYAANSGFLLQEQNGKAFNGLIIGHGTDNGDRALVIKQCNVAEFVNLELVVIDNSLDIVYIDVENTNTGDVRFYNSLCWGQRSTSKKAFVISGGAVTLQQGRFYEVSQSLIGLVNGGRVNISGLILNSSKVHFQVDNSVQQLALIGNIAIPNDTSIQVGEDVLTVVNNAGDKLKLQSNVFK